MNTYTRHRSHSNPWSLSPQERLAKILVDKVVAKMPNSSGLSLSALEDDISLLQEHEALCQLSRHCAEIMVWSLCENLDRLQAKHVGPESSLDIFESEIYLIRVLILILEFRKNCYVTVEPDPAPETPQPSELSPDAPPELPLGSQRSATLFEPPALEDSVAEYCIAVMLRFISRSGSNRTEAFKPGGELYDSDIPHSLDSIDRERIRNRLPIRLDLNSEVFQGWFQPYMIATRDPSDRDSISTFASDGSIPSFVTYLPSPSGILQSSFTKGDPKFIIHLAGRVIFYLSACNWPAIFIRVKNQIHSLAVDTTNEGQDIVNLRLITYSVIDKTRLVQILQEMSPLLITMSPASQCAVAVALRAVMWNWIKDFTTEFIDVVKSRSQLNGQPERLFDLFHKLADSGHKPFLWPTLTVLLATSPDRLQAADAVYKGTLKLGEPDFFKQLHRVLKTQSKLAEVAVVCYNDICRAAFNLPPQVAGTVLRPLASRLAEELKVRLMNPPPPNLAFYNTFIPIDINLHTEALVVVLRYHHTLDQVGYLSKCLDPNCTSSVKLCAIKALTILVAEAPRFPWQFSLDKFIYSVVAPKLRAIAMGLQGHAIGRSPRQPTSVRDGQVAPKDFKELMLSLHALWRLDFGLFFTGIKDQEYIPLIEACLKVFQPPRDESIRVSTFQTLGAISSILNNQHDKYYHSVRKVMNHAAAISLQNAAEELLCVTNDYTANKYCLNVILVILSQLADRSLQDGYQDWNSNEKALIALATVETALLVSLVSSRTDICSSAARGLHLLAMCEQDPEGQLTKSFVREQAWFRTRHFKAMGNSRAGLFSQVDFQKKMRNTIGPSVHPCVPFLESWKECYYRWSALTPIVTANATRSSVGVLSAGILIGSSGRPTPEQRQVQEWEDLTLFLASAGASCMSDDPAVSASPQCRIPFRKGISDQKPSDLIQKFISELVQILVAPWVPARTIGQQALGVEMTPVMFPVLFDHLDDLIKVMFGVDSEFTQSTIVFIEQILSVFKLIIDRVGKLLIKVDVGDNLLALGRFIHQCQRSASVLHIKVQFCVLVDNLVEKRGVLQIIKDDLVRNSLLDMVVDWILDFTTIWPDNDLKRTEQLQAQYDSNVAALNTCSNLVKNLGLQVYDGSDSTEMPRIASRLFHRYFTIFITALNSDRVKPVPPMTSNQVPERFGGKTEHSIQGLVVSAIGHMFHANTGAGMKDVLSLGYSDNPRLFSVFAQVFRHVLRRGITFHQHVEGTEHSIQQDNLCEMVRESETLSLAIIDVCPTPEIDTIVPVFLNIYNTRRTLLDLLKRMIHQQVEITNSDTELFLTNGMCSRLLSAFAKQHGYSYLRSIISHLITFMLDLTSVHGYELDSAKLRPGETQSENAQSLETITTAFLAVISKSVRDIPSIIREVCRYIDDAVTFKWPESSHNAVGAFVFRLIVPAILDPQSIDIEIPRSDPRATNTRRGLFFVAKIIHNLSNNTMFREAHMTILNPFIRKHTVQLYRFRMDILEVALGQPAHSPEESLGTSHDETDTLILHRFFQTHGYKVGDLLSSKAVNNYNDMHISGKQTWDRVRVLLRHMGSAMEPPLQSDRASNQHQAFRAFMDKNGHRDMGPVSEIFQDTTEPQCQRSLFVLFLSRIDVENVDLDLLMCHIFKTIQNRTEFEQPFDVVLDFTAFTSVSEVPISSCKLFLEHLPSDLLRHFDTAYILSSNATAQIFLRKLYYVCTDAKLANKVMAFSSMADLTQHLHPASLNSMSHLMEAEIESSTYFECHQLNPFRMPMLIQIGISHIRITSLKTRPIYPNLSCKTVEVIRLVNIGDIVSSIRNPTDFAVQPIDGDTLSFSSLYRNDIVKAIQGAMDRFKSMRARVSIDSSGRSEDIPAALLRISMFNICDEEESLRLSAYDLLSSVCSYANYELNPIFFSPNGASIPTNTISFIVPLSERLATSAPHLTLGLIIEFFSRFENSSTLKKITCLQYLTPWVKNLVMFARPGSPLHEPTGGKLRECIRSLLDIAVELPDIYPTLQKSVWTALESHIALLDIALEELTRLLASGGLSFRRCDRIADSFIDMSSIHVRAKVLTKLQMLLAEVSAKHTTGRMTQHRTWDAISAFSRVAHVAVYSSRLAAVETPSHLFVAEIAHLVTMLCGTGTLTEKSAIYGMAINMTQSLHGYRAHEERPEAELTRLLERLSHPDVLLQFGLVPDTSGELSSVRDTPDQISISALEGITDTLIKVLTHGAESTDDLNLWRNRWMSLVVASTSEVSAHIQYRAFAVLGVLTSSNVAMVEDDVIRQMLVAFKNSLESILESDHTVALSILRCITRNTQRIGSDCCFLPRVFWLAVALLQSAYLPLYEEASRLLKAALEAMADRGFFKDHNMSTVLLQARLPLLGVATQLDDIKGLSFDMAFSFSLASIIFRGSSSPMLLPSTKALLKTLLCIATDSSAGRSDFQGLADDVLGYFLASLPFASTSTSYRNLLKEARVPDERWWPLSSPTEDDEEDVAVPKVDTNIFRVWSEDSCTPLLVVSFIFMMLDSYQGIEQEREMLFCLLAQLASVYPDLCASAVVHFLGRSEWLMDSLTDDFVGSTSGVSAVHSLFRVAMESPAWSVPTSSTMVPKRNDASGGRKTAHYKALEELDMHSLAGTWQFATKDQASKVLRWIPHFVDAMISTV